MKVYLFHYRSVFCEIMPLFFLPKYSCFIFFFKKEKFFKLNMMLADVVFVPRAVASWIQNPRQGWIYMYLKYKKWTKFNQHLSHLLKSKTTILHLSKVNLNPGKRSHYHRWGALEHSNYPSVLQWGCSVSSTLCECGAEHCYKSVRVDQNYPSVHSNL